MKLREFWVIMQGDEGYENPESICWAYYPSDKPTDPKSILVREVSSDQEAAIQKMVEALEGLADSRGTAAVVAEEALEAWRKVNK